VVDEAVDGCDSDGLIWEDLVLGAERLVGRDGKAPGLVAPRDQFEEHGAFGLILLGIGDVIEDDHVELVELCEGGFEGEVAAGGLKPLHHVGCAGVEDAKGFRRLKAHKQLPVLKAALLRHREADPATGVDQAAKAA